MIARAARGGFAWLALGMVLGGCGGPPRDAARERRSAEPLAVRLAGADAANGARLFRRCAACHNIAAGSGDRDGPNLHGVVGARIGHNSPSFAYTGALQAIGGTWNDERLDRWLTAPQRFAPGTSMGFAGLPDGADRTDVIAFLTETSRR